jgi:hypothetical protein
VFEGPLAYNAETGDKLRKIDPGGTNVTPITYDRLFTLVLDGKESVPAKKVVAQ